MTIKKSFYLRALSLVVAFLLTFTTVMVFPTNLFASAEGGKDRRELSEEKGEVGIASVKLNGVEINPNSPDNRYKVDKGSLFSLVFAWLVQKDSVIDLLNTEFTYDFSDKLKFFDIGKGINLDPVYERNQETGEYELTCEYYIDENGILVIDPKSGIMNPAGSCTVEATLNWNDLGDLGDGKFELEIFGETYYFEFEDTTPVPRLDVSKYSVDNNKSNKIPGTRIYENGGKYYIDYKVEVKSYNGTATDVTLTDELTWGTIVPESVKITRNGNTTSGSFNNNVLTIGEVNDVNDSYENIVYVEYTVELTEIDKYKVIKQEKYENTITAEGTAQEVDNPLHDEDSDTVWVNKPSVYKSHSLNDDKTQITWTIVIRPNALGDDKFTLTDEILSGANAIDASVLKDIFGDPDASGTYSITFEELKNKDGVVYDANQNSYTITYTTDVNSSVVDSEGEVTIKNKAAIDFTDDTNDDVNAEFTDSVTLKKELDIEKTYELVNGGFKYTVTLKIPDGEISDLFFCDTVTASDAVDIDHNSLTFYVLDGNQKTPVTEDFINGVQWNGTYWQYSSEWNSVVPTKYRGKTIVIEYFVKSADPEKSITKISNKAEAKMKVDSKEIKGEATTTYTLKNFSIKKGTLASNSKPYPIKWVVGTISSEALKQGNVITITDTIPNGYKLVDGSVKPCVFKKWDNEIDGYEFNLWNGEKNPLLSVSHNDNEYTFKITLQAGWSYPNYVLSDLEHYGLGVIYQTEMEDNEYKDLLEKGKKIYTNDATVTIGNYSEDVSADCPVEVNNKDVVNKWISGKKDVEGKYKELTYIVDINPNKLKLNPYADTIEAKDTLGRKLSLLGNDTINIKITKQQEDGSFIQVTGSEAGVLYDNNSKTITFTGLMDETYYRIEYIVEAEYLSSIWKIDDKEITEEELAQDSNWYDNMITITAGKQAYSDSAKGQLSDFKTSSTFTSNLPIEPISIDISKRWLNFSKNDDLDYTITIKLTQKLNNEETETFEATISLEDFQGGTWTNITPDFGKDLPRYPTNNTTPYEYYIEEVKVEDSDGNDVTNNFEIGGYNKVIKTDTTVIITNTYKSDEDDDNEDDDKISVSVTKSWVGDNENSRPDTITVYLTDENGQKVSGTDAVLNRKGNGNWSHTWTGLDKGTYSVVEDPVPGGYSSSGAVKVEKDDPDDPNDSDLEFTITNNYDNKTIEITLTKNWVDNTGTVTTFPDVSALEFKLSAKATVNGKTVDVPESVYTSVNRDDNNSSKKITFSNLPKYYKGALIEYTIEEVKNETLNDYTLPGAVTVTQTAAQDQYGYEITNTYNKTPDEKISVTVTKKWAGDNKAQNDHEGITVKLNRKGATNNPIKTADLNSTKGWSVTWDELEGDISEYTVEEELPADYVGVYTKKIGDIKPVGNSTTEYTCEITNTYVAPATKNVKVIKKWEDDNNSLNKRPTSITVNLIQVDENGKEKVLEGKSKTLTSNSTAEWEGEWTDLDAKYSYKVSEVVPDGYDSDIKLLSYDKNSLTYTYQITNTYEFESLSVSKKWVGNNPNQPTSVTVYLTKNGEDEGNPVTLNEGNGWSHTWKNLEKGPDYYVREVLPTGYSDYDVELINGDSTYNYEITNTYNAPNPKNVYISKTWTNEPEEGNTRPNITFNLYQDGNLYDSHTVGEDDNWEWKWENLSGEYNYTVTESKVNDYSSSFKKTINGDNINYAFTNRYNANDESNVTNISVSVSKKWDHGTNPNPPSENSEILVQLYQGNSEYGEAQPLVNGEYTWNDLDPNYEYTVKEVTTFTDYKATVDNDESTENSLHFTITNTYTGQTAPATKNIKVIKVWDDNDNAAGKRPDSVTINLIQVDKAGRKTTYESKTLPDNGKWEYTWNDLAAEYSYEITEDTVDDYTPSAKKTADRTADTPLTYTITNTYDSTTVTVHKRWEGDDPEQPNSVTVQLYQDGNIYDDPVTLEANDDPDKNWTYTWSGLEKGHVYTVDEDTVEGYDTEIRTIKESRNLYEYEIVNTLITAKVILSKTDLGGNEVSGAKIKITNADGTVVKEWISGDENNTFELPDGNYTLTEEVAPDGYGKITTNITFTVKSGKVIVAEVAENCDTRGSEDETTLTIIIRDTPIKDLELIKTYADANLRTMDSGERDKLLQNTKFTLTDKKTGKTFPEASPEWDSEKEMAVVTFKGSELKAEHTYELKETKAPDGYAVSSNVYTCEIAPDGTVTYKLNGATIDFMECVNIKSSGGTQTDPSTPSEIVPAAPGVKPVGEDISSGAEIYAESDIFSGNRFKAAMIISSLMVVVVAFAESFIIRIWKKKKSMKR